MRQLQLRVINEVGLHARPAALFVKEAGRFASEVKVRNLTAGSAWVNAKSILGVLSIGVEQDHDIELSFEGEDEEQAATALEALIVSDFKAGA